MGRYYTGDIEGKFWFGVQDSNDAEHFGAYEIDTMINYCVPNGEEVNQGVNKCLEKLGNNKEILDEFFQKNNGYNDQMIVEFFKSKGIEITLNKIHPMLSQYARLRLGKQIQDFFKEHPDYEELYIDAEVY